MGDEQSRRRINRLLDRLGSWLPEWGARVLESARNPTARWVRIGIAIALILGGMVGFIVVALFLPLVNLISGLS